MKRGVPNYTAWTNPHFFWHFLKCPPTQSYQSIKHNVFILEFCCTRRRQIRPRTYLTCQNFHIYFSQLWFIDSRCFKLDRVSDFENEIWHLKKSFYISTSAHATWNFKIDTWQVPAYSAPDNEGPLAITKYFQVHTLKTCWKEEFISNYCYNLS